MRQIEEKDLIPKGKWITKNKDYLAIIKHESYSSYSYIITSDKKKLLRAIRNNKPDATAAPSTLTNWLNRNDAVPFIQKITLIQKER